MKKYIFFFDFFFRFDLTILHIQAIITVGTAASCGLLAIIDIYTFYQMVSFRKKKFILILLRNNIKGFYFQKKYLKIQLEIFYFWIIHSEIYSKYDDYPL